MKNCRWVERGKKYTREKNTRKSKQQGNGSNNNTHKNHCRLILYEYWTKKTWTTALLRTKQKKKPCDCKYEKSIHRELNDDGGKNAYIYTNKQQQQQQKIQQRQQQSPIITTSNPLNKLSLDDSSQNDTNKKEIENTMRKKRTKLN